MTGVLPWPGGESGARADDLDLPDGWTPREPADLLDEDEVPE